MCRCRPRSGFVSRHELHNLPLRLRGGSDRGALRCRKATRGVNTLIKSVEDERHRPERQRLRRTWLDLALRHARSHHRSAPSRQAIKHIGEDNVLWGTDSIWYGSPQDQIQAFRTFQIAPDLIEAHGYPELTTVLKQRYLASMGLASMISTCLNGAEKLKRIRSGRARRPIGKWRIRPSKPTGLRPTPSTTR